MEKTFTFAIHRYINGSWRLVRKHAGIGVNQKRKLINSAKRLGYEYSSIHHAYITKKNGLVCSIARFTID